MKISQILDSTRESFPTVLPMQSSSSIHHFWPASLTANIATHSQQPPERSVLSHVASAVGALPSLTIASGWKQSFVEDWYPFWFLLSGSVSIVRAIGGGGRPFVKYDFV